MKAALKKALKTLYKKRVAKVESLFNQLKDELRDMGLSFDYTIKLDERIESRSSGPRQYWATINKIVKERGCSFKQARKIYLSEKKGEVIEQPTKKVRSNPRLVAARKAYWKKVHQYMKQHDVPVRVAREKVKLAA